MRGEQLFLTSLKGRFISVLPEVFLDEEFNVVFREFTTIGCGNEIAYIKDLVESKIHINDEYCVNLLLQNLPMSCIKVVKVPLYIIKKLLYALEYYSDGARNPYLILDRLRRSNRNSNQISDINNNVYLQFFISKANQNFSDAFVLYLPQQKIYLNFLLSEFVLLYDHLHNIVRYLDKVFYYNNDYSNKKTLQHNKLSVENKKEIVVNNVEDISEKESDDNKEEVEVKKNDNIDNDIYKAAQEISNFIDQKINNIDTNSTTTTTAISKSEEEYKEKEYIDNNHKYDYITYLSIIKPPQVTEYLMYNYPLSKKVNECSVEELVSILTLSRILRHTILNNNDIKGNDIAFLLYRFIVENILPEKLMYHLERYLKDNNITFDSTYPNLVIYSYINLYKSQEFRNYILNQIKDISSFILNEDFKSTVFYQYYKEIIAKFMYYINNVKDLGEFYKAGLLENKIFKSQLIFDEINKSFSFNTNKLFEDIFKQYCNVDMLTKISNDEYQNITLSYVSNYYLYLNKQIVDAEFNILIVRYIIKNNSLLAHLDIKDFYNDLISYKDKNNLHEQIKYFLTNSEYTDDLLQKLYNNYNESFNQIFEKASITDINNDNIKIVDIYNEYINNNVSDVNLQNLLLKYKPKSIEHAISLLILIPPNFNKDLVVNFVDYVKEKLGDIKYSIPTSFLFKVIPSLRDLVQDILKFPGLNTDNFTRKHKLLHEIIKHLNSSIIFSDDIVQLFNDIVSTL